MKRVVVTGMGVISPLGNSTSRFWDNLIRGNNAIYPVEDFDCGSFNCQVAGQIREPLPEFKFKNKRVQERLEKTDSSIRYLICALDEALKSAGLSEKEIEGEEISVILGQTVGGVINGERVLGKILKGDPDTFDHLYMNTTIDSLLYWVNACFHIKGYADVVSTGCAAGTDAIGCAFQLLRSGECDIAVTGGTEAPLSKLTLEAFDVIGALARADKNEKKASAPFSKNRSGFVASEGAGIVVLETLEHALNRNCEIYAEVIDYANNSNAYHMTAPDPDGIRLAECIRLVDSSMSNKTEYINTHGSSTKLNDIAETKAIKAALGSRAYDISLNSNKSIMGHPIGAAGALEFISCVLAVKNGIIPPTINLEEPDPDCDLDYTPNTLKRRKIENAITISSGFGGVNCAVALSNFKG